MAKSVENEHPVQPAPATKSPRHRASYATDKKTGGYLVRVVGPTPAEFAGRKIPVGTKAGTQHEEELERLVWTGQDKETGEPVALYKFKSKPREKVEVEF